jgi:hypothetical protein
VIRNIKITETQKKKNEDFQSKNNNENGYENG